MSFFSASSLNDVTSPPQASSYNWTTRKRKLKRTIGKLHMRIHHSKVKADGRKGKRPIAQIKKDLIECLPVSTVEFITSQLEMTQRKNKGCRWSHSDKMLALSIFFIRVRKHIRCLGNCFIYHPKTL